MVSVSSVEINFCCQIDGDNRVFNLDRPVANQIDFKSICSGGNIDYEELTLDIGGRGDICAAD
jgi:hypothetical protein